MPIISIIMPVYNSAQFLHEAIDSILKQTFTDFEFIIVLENGNRDHSEEIIRWYMERDKRIVLLMNEERMGISRSLNKGIDCALGQYIARMDADDIALPNRLELQLDFMRSNPDISVCGTEVEFINHQGKLTPPVHDNFPNDHDHIKSGLIFNCFIRHPTVMFRKRDFDEYNLRYNEDLSSSEDFELWSRACHIVNFANLDTILLKYRVHDSNYTQLRKQEGISNYLTAMNATFARLGIAFSEEEMRLLCPLTCDINESNKRHIMVTLQRCAEIIRQANNEKQIYNNDALEQTLEVRIGWTKFHVRHKMVTAIRFIAGMLERVFPNKVASIYKLAGHLELYGVVSMLKKTKEVILSSDRRRYLYENK